MEQIRIYTEFPPQLLEREMYGLSYESHALRDLVTGYHI